MRGRLLLKSPGSNSLIFRKKMSALGSKVARLKSSPMRVRLISKSKSWRTSLEWIEVSMREALWTEGISKGLAGWGG